MNSMAADVTMYTDESVVCDGPDPARAVVLGLGAAAAREHGDPDALGPELAAELRAVTASTFPSRRLQSAYLDLGAAGRDRRAACRACGCSCTARVATGLTEDGDDAAGARWPTARALRVDAVVLASGHLDADPDRGRAGRWPPGPPRRAALPAAGADHRHRPVRCSRRGRRCWSAAWGWPSSTSSCCCSRAAAAASSRRSGRDELRYLPSGAEPRLVVGLAAGGALPLQDALPAARRPPAAAPVLRPGRGRRADRARPSRCGCASRSGR